MTPKEEVAVLYELYRQPRSFARDIYLHTLSGYVIDTPTAFLMGRPVCRDAPEEAIRDPAISFSRWAADCWFIFAFAGDIGEMLHLAPYELPYVGWSRRNGAIRWYTCAEALARVKRYETNRHFAQRRRTDVEEIRPG